MLDAADDGQVASVVALALGGGSPGLPRAQRAEREGHLKRKRELEDGHTAGGNRHWVQVAAPGALGPLLAAPLAAPSAAVPPP